MISDDWSHRSDLACFITGCYEVILVKKHTHGIMCTQYMDISNGYNHQNRKYIIANCMISLTNRVVLSVVISEIWRCSADISARSRLE